MKKIAVCIVDDHKLFRKTLKGILENIPNVKIVGEAANGKIFLEILKNVLVDVVFMDIKMPEMNGIEATMLGRKISPETKFIGLSMFDEETYFLSMVNAGVKGFLLKDTNKTEIKKALLAVNSGENYYSEGFRKILDNKSSGNIKI